MKHIDALASGCRHNAELWARAVSLLGTAAAWLAVPYSMREQQQVGQDIARFLEKEAKTWDYLEGDLPPTERI